MEEAKDISSKRVQFTLHGATYTFKLGTLRVKTAAEKVMQEWNSVGQLADTEEKVGLLEAEWERFLGTIIDGEHSEIDELLDLTEEEVFAIRDLFFGASSRTKTQGK